MKRAILFLFISVFSICVSAQSTGTIFQNNRLNGENPSFNPDWAPFYHGVASGDPLEDRVVIWTRVTPEEMDATVDVSWKVATDPLLEQVVQSGNFTTDASRDYTVKVDVTGLEPGNTYYYGFSAFGANSLTGRTKTTPTGELATHLKFGVVSCSNYQAGYFNAYGRLAERNDLDAILHLGDYIYEYANSVYGADSLFDVREMEPANEIVSVADYRARYSTYRLDTNLIRVHQQHPFITVWDDHETANDAYKDGAENHDPETEGDWETRKANGKQVYFEWMPIRDNEDQRVYRKISYGNLMDLIMLDTRLEGREIQINNVLDSALLDSTRTILGAEQKAWLLDQLANSSAQWKVIGQQVIFSELNVGWAALVDDSFEYFDVESQFLDIWDGYPAERKQLMDYIKENEIDNVVILTGDFHTSFAFDVVDDPVEVLFQPSPLGELPTFSSPNYDPATGEGSIAVEFACPSINSANFDENVDLESALTFQSTINQPIIPFPGLDLGNPNTHMKYTNLIEHGFFILDIKADSAQADYFFTPILEITDSMSTGESWYTTKDQNYLKSAVAPSAPKAAQDSPAPADPPMLTNTQDEVLHRKFALLGVYPNPFFRKNTLHYSLSTSAQVQIDLYDFGGRKIRSLVNEKMPAGIYSLEVDGENLESGTYTYRIQVDGQVYNSKVILSK
jgi:alkaline phosphatase D